MLGAIAGDVIGSVHEATATKTKQFLLFVPESTFTDDTVLTAATAEAILNKRGYVDAYKVLFREFPVAGFGGSFFRWASSPDKQPYNSWGNGSAMRVSPVAYAHDTLEGVLAEATRSAAVTHNPEQGIRGAQATASAVFLARTGATKEQIRSEIESRFGYDLNRTLRSIRPGYLFDVSCQGSVPESIIAFLEADSFEDAVRNAISLGGDADTMACIAGAIAEPFFGIPELIANAVLNRLPPRLREVVVQFESQFANRVRPRLIAP